MARLTSRSRKKPVPPRKQRPSIVVGGLSRPRDKGMLVLGNQRLACALGRAGRRVGKREGDGATPVGRFRLIEVLYRADRVPRPRASLPVRPLRRDDGWCDDPTDRNYNRRVQHPYPASAEHLWRADALYDLIVVLGYNDRPRIRGRGSALFMHVAGDGLAPTAGCVALRRCDLQRLLSRLGPGAVIRILP